MTQQTFTDLVNTFFSFGSFLFLIVNVLQIRKDKLVAGVHWASCAFFLGWNLWDIWFYDAAHQPLTAFVQGVRAVLNIYYTGLIIYYHFKPKHLVV